MKALTIIVQHAPQARRWHRALAERLAARGHAVQLRPVACGSPARQRQVGWLLRIERRLYRAHSVFHASDAQSDGAPAAGVVAQADLAPPAGMVPDLVVVLAGEAPATGRAIRPLFDGMAGEGALFTALLAGRAPAIGVVRCADGRLLASGLPAVEDPQVLARALDHVLPRLVTLLVQAVGRVGEPGSPLSAPRGDGAPPPPRHGTAAGFLARGLAAKLRHRLVRANASRWQLALRLVEEEGVAQARCWPAQAYHPVPVAPDRLHADPFVLAHGGRSHVFFEEMAFATGKGVIARVEVNGRGEVSAPRPVLELPVHLSYPLVLRHDGGIFMLPEMSAARRLTLYRAKPFPDRWVQAAVLLDDTVVADATPVVHDGRWWIAAQHSSLLPANRASAGTARTLNDDGGSSWDQLALFHAPDLLGPWTPHAGNPVLVHAGAARPAGAMWHADGVLMRVAQDCRSGYGCGLAICRVDRLDLDGYAQTVVARLDPPPGSGAAGVHTLNRDGRLEVIDLRQP